MVHGQHGGVRRGKSGAAIFYDTSRLCLGRGIESKAVAAECVFPIDTEVGLRILVRLEKFHFDRNEILRFVDAAQIVRYPPVLLAGSHDPKNVRVRVVNDLRLLRGDIDREHGLLLSCRSSTFLPRATAQFPVEGRNARALHLGPGGRFGIGHHPGLTVFERLHSEHDADLVDNARRLGFEDTLRVLQWQLRSSG